MSFQPIEILLVDDNDDDIILMQEALAESKVLNVVQTVGDGEEALQYLRGEGSFSGRRLPGLVLMDINMPRKNGLETLRELKGDPALAFLPVVMLTVSDREADIFASYSNGACTYVRKPLRLEELKKVVSQFEIYWTMVARIPH